MNKTTLGLLMLILPTVIVIGIIPDAFAKYPIQNANNDHYYEYVPAANISWTDAKIAAESKMFDGISGHLVTITSESENQLIDGLLSTNTRAWIGLTDEGTEGQYKWVTGEQFDYTNWDVNQPNNSGGNENYTEFLGSNGKWNDNIDNYPNITGYFVEYSPILQNPTNGNYYKHINDIKISWTDAKTAAENSTYNGITGHLVTITSASENNFVADLAPENSRVWMGLTDETTEGTYQWVTGEPFNYTNWALIQPTGLNENYIELVADGRWNDVSNNDTGITGYIIEYDLPDPTLNPENGHYYEYIIDRAISWTDAKTAAENSTYNGTSGHLVTITTASENDFVANLKQDDVRPWIGLSDESTEGDYKWVTGEAFSYANWSPGEPSAGTNEDYVEFFASNDKWNDNTNNNQYITGYIIEYTPPTKNPENGHYYEYIIDRAISWTDAKAAAESHTYNGVSGHLVTITSQSENDFVSELVPDNYAFTWMGLSDETTEGTYQWVTGEPFVYSNWDANQPDNYNGNEDYVQFRGYSDKWNDIKNDPDYINGYIIEYSD